MNRRSFLIGTTGLISQLIVPARGWAQSPDSFFVLVRVQGGMDVTLGLDPQVHSGTDQQDIFIEYRPDEIFTRGTLKLGPAAMPLVSYADRIATVNGLFMSTNDLGHSEGNRYAASGSARQSAMTLSQGIGFGLGTGPYGMLVSGQTSSSSSTMVSRLEDVLYNRVSDSIASATVGPFAKASSGESAFTKSQKSFIEAASVGPAVQEALEKFRRESGVLNEQHALAAAFATNAAHQAEIFITNFNLDSHSAHERNHLNTQRTIWSNVANLFSVFSRTPYRSGSLLDATTFLVVGEFSRTAALNTAGGKDHNNYTNSALLAGRGIRGAQNVGSSMVIPRRSAPNQFPLHLAAPFDFKTGQRAEMRQSAELIRPENIARTIGELFGNPAGIDVTSNTKVIPGILKT